MSESSATADPQPHTLDLPRVEGVRTDYLLFDAGSDFSPLTVFLAEDADSLDWSADFIHGSDITRVLLILRDEEQEEQEIEHEHLDLKQIATAGSDDLPTY